MKRVAVSRKEQGADSMNVSLFDPQFALCDLPEDVGDLLVAEAREIVG
jgi:hypothetical protein